MASWRHVFILFGGLIVWTVKLFRVRYEDLITHEKDYFNFFLGLGTSLLLIVLIGRVLFD